ncbi:MAG: hypothetical protein R2826_00360 [Thermoleophilia bacterium]
MQTGRALIRTPLIAPIVLCAMVPVCAVVASLLGHSAWAAAAGAALVLLYWALDVVAMRIGARVKPTIAVAVGVAGSVVRLSVVVAVLVVIAFAWREALATSILAFVASLTVYLGVRVATFPLARGPVGTVKAQ